MSAPAVTPAPAGYLEVGSGDRGMVVIVHSVGRLVFTPDEARRLAALLLEKAGQAAAERSAWPPSPRERLQLQAALNLWLNIRPRSVRAEIEGHMRTLGHKPMSARELKALTKKLNADA